MIINKKHFCSDLVLDDLVYLCPEELEHLINFDCALALSVCKSRNLPSCVFVLSLLYIKRLREVQSSALSKSLLEIEQLTTKELYLIATLLADKYLIDEGEDEQIFNSELSELTGIRYQRINLIERQLLIALNWNLFVPHEEINDLIQILKRTTKNKSEQTNNHQNIFEYIILTSLVVLGSTVSILTAIHMGIVTQSLLMNTFNPIETNYYQTQPNISYQQLPKTSCSFELFDNDFFSRTVLLYSTIDSSHSSYSTFSIV